MPEPISRDDMTKSQLKKSIIKFTQYYEAKREEGLNKTLPRLNFEVQKQTQQTQI